MARLRLRSDLALVLVCMALYVGAAAQARTGGRSALGVALTTLSRPVIWGTNALTGAWADLLVGQRDIRHVLAELHQIRRELAEARRTNQLLATEVAELRQGSRLLAAFPQLHEGTVVARVVARDVLSTNSVLLDRGRADGVRSDAAVLTETGVLGRVDLVTERGARVQLLTHPAAAAAARIVGIEGETLLEGGERPHLTGLPPYTEVESGAPVLTTGSEGIYPAGLLLGTTESAATEGLFTIVRVRLAVRPGQASVVLVIPPPETTS